MAAKNRWEEYKEKKSAQKTTGQQDSGKQSQTKKNRLEEYREKKGGNSASIDKVATSISERVNTWLTNHNNYLKNYQTRYSDRKYSYEDSYVSDSGSWLDTVSKQKSAFDAEADSILSYMDLYSDYLDADWMKSVRDTLTGARNQQNIIIEGATKDNEWWSNFKDETEYQTAARYDGYSKKYTGANSEDIKKALDTIGLGEERDWLQYYKGNIVDDTVRSDADFKKYASQGATIDYTDFGTEEWHKGKSRRQRGYNSIDKYRAASLALAEHYGNEAPLGSQGQYEEQVAIYRTMKDEEFENLAYYIAYDKEHGTNRAEQYVDFMEETLSQRRGTDIGEKVTNINIPVIEDLAVMGYGALAGVNNFAFGVEQFMSDEELAHYPSYYANANIADSLDGFGYYAHSAATTIGNMGPSILLSSALSGLGVPGKVAEGVGSATMGVSAAGNAYKDALSKGYDKESARTYGNLVGASEGVLQYLIGGISKLGGVSGKLASKISAIDNALLRGSAKLGVNIGGEILEEEIQNYLEPAFRTILFGEEYDAPTIDEIIETALVTMLSTGTLEAGGTVRETRAETALNKQTVKQYGEHTDALIQKGLESDQMSESYKLAQKYQKQVQGKDGKQGKAMTGAQIRSLLAANQAEVTNSDLKNIQNEAANRLMKLGQREDVTKLAKIATKYVTGGEVSIAEKRFLANSDLGSQVTSEMLNAMRGVGSDKLLSRWENDISDGMGDTYSTEWAENIETKAVYNEAQAKKMARAFLDVVANQTTYKSLESRMEAEEPAKVSDTGKAVIRATDEEIDLTSPTFKQISKDGVTLDVNGKDVNANDIDYESESQGLAINAISKIEHITPAAATALYAKLDMTKPVMEQLNGIDEAFSYGYYNYSEADLEAGDFAKNLTQEQKTDAYKLGQYVAKNTVTESEVAIKNMRTAADAAVEKAKAEGKEAPKGKKLSVTYNHGGGVVEDISTAKKKLGKLTKEQRGGMAAAEILHQMGIGTDFELFTSYYSKTLKDKEGNPLEVFLNDDGQEQAAYAGVYMAANGKIRINLNAYSGTRGLALNALSHELTHFIKTWSPEKYKAMAEFLVKSYGEKGVSMHQLVLKEQARLKEIRGEEVSYSEAYDEVVANAFNRMLEDGKVMDRIAEIRQMDKSLGDKIIECIRNFVKKFFKVYQKNQSLFMETEALMQMKEVYEQLQSMFSEALVEASDNFQASLIAKEAGLDIAPVEASTQYSYQSLAEAAGFAAVENEDGTRSFVRDGKAVSEVTVNDIDNSPIGAFINFSLEMGDINEADAKRQKEMFAEICTMACKTNDFAMTMQFVGSAVFTGMKANADKQYGTTYDFPSICTKTQAVIDAMSAKMMALGRGLNADEIVKLYDDVFASGNPVPCPECYVFSRWIGIGGLLDNIKKYQDYYGDMDVADVAEEYRKMKAEVSKFAEEQGISFGKAKGALTSNLTKEFNKLTEKIEKAQNQGEKVKPADLKRLEELEPMMNTVKGMTWLENVYFADSTLKKVNPRFRVPNDVLFDLNNGEAFATKYKEAWAFRTTQGAGYGKAITPYAEARLGEGVLVTNNTTNAIKGRAQGTLDNYFLQQMGKLDKKSRDALKRARLKQKIQAFIGGQRFQSTSDARYENASDYLLAALEMQAMGGMVQVYTKVDGAVPAFSAWGFSINQSLMPLNGGLDADGNVKDTAVGGMKPSVAFENRNKHESAGTITIGVNDNHIRAMFKQWVRDFIIPYHASGGKADTIAEFRRIQEGKEAKGKAVRSTDYSRTQSDKVLSDEVLRWQGKTDAQIQRIHEIRNARIAILTGGNVNMTVVRSNRFLSALYDKLNGGEWDGVKLAKSKVESQIYPNEFWDQTVSYDESAKITKDYLEYCEDLGFLHRFSGMIPSNGKLVPANGYDQNGNRVQLTDLAYKYDENGNKTAEVEEFFWKVLTDRRMYDNNGKYLAQKVVTLNDTTADTVTGFAKNNQGREYDKAKAEALAKKIAGEQYSSQKTDFSKEFDYSELNWATDLGIITAKDRAIFERTINNEIFRGAKPQTANGEYIIDTGKCLMFTDGDFHNPTLSRVIVFATEYESLTADAKEMIVNEAKATGEVQQSIQTIEKMFGSGFVSVRNQPTGRSNGRQVRGRKGSNRSGTSQTTRAKSIKERLTEEGKEHLLYSTQQTDNITNRHLLANAFEGITNGSEEYKLIQKYKGYIAELNSLESKLSEFNRQIRDIRFGKGQYDAEKLQKLEGEAKNIADAINKYDQYLLSLEASEPLRKVIERERKKEAQKTKDHVKEIQQNKKLRAEQTELRHKIRKAVRDLDKILNRGNKKLNVKEDMQNVVTKALQAADILFTDNYGTYDMLRNGIKADLSDAEEALVDTCTQMLKDLDKMPTDGYDSFMARQEAENKLKTKMSKLNDVFARERKRLNNTTVSSILGELADAYASLEKSEQSYVQGAYTEAVHNFLKNLQSEVGGAIVKDMTKDQLESVYAAYKMVLTAVRTANKMFNEDLKLSREQLGNAVIEEVIKAGGVHGLWTRAEIARSQAGWNNTKPVWVANRIGSDTFSKLMNGLFKGQYNFAVDVDEAKRFKLEMDKKYKPRNWDSKKLYEFESSTGSKFSLNLQQIMSLYAFSKRDQAYSHLLNGGFVFEGNTTVMVDKKGIKRTYIHNGATSYKLNEATLNGIINSLTAEQKAYVDEMQKYLSEVMGAKGNEVSMKLYGIQMFKEQFYFPLRSSGAYMERAKEAELKKQQGQINLVNSGFTHAVKPEAKNPIILSGFMDVWAEHCNEMSMYHSMVLPMEDFRKVYNYSTIHDENMESASVYQTIQDAYGKAATDYIDQLYRELNAGATVDPRETPFKARISKFKKAAVMLSASVVVQQFSAIGRAYAIIDPKYFIGTKVNSGTLMSVADEMKKYAPIAIIKEMGGFDTGTKGSAKNYIMAEQYGKGERIKGLLKDEQYRGDIMGFAPAKADEITWCAIWEAVKRETKAKNPKMDIKSEEFLKLAGERFSEVIEKTQVYDSVLARSANMRSKGTFMSMATAFMAEPTTTVNLLEDAIRSGKAKNIARAFGSVAASIVLNNALSSLIYAMRDDDDDETFIEKYFQSFASSMVDDINPMSYYPFLKDVYSLFQGYDVERADMSVIADVRDAMKRVVSLLGQDTSEMDDDKLAEYYKQVNEVLMGLLDAGCSMFGVPVKNVRRDVNGIINAYNTIHADITKRDTTWNSFWDKVGSAVKDTIPIYAWTKDKAKPDKLYEAIIGGDKAYLGRIKATYKTEDAYHSAVRTALRENDSRIREAAMAQINGDPSKRVQIAKQIIADGFNQDDVITAINSEISKLTDSGEDAAKKVKGYYKVEDFVREAANGDAAVLEDIREDIINTAVANGKTVKKATEDFVSNVKSETKDAYLADGLSDSTAEKLLTEYVGMEEAEATELVDYWSFSKANPQYDLSQSNVEKYLEFGEPAEIPLDVFVQYLEGTKGLATIKDEWGDEVKSEREQVLEVIDSLPLTWQQKDVLYLAHGYAESEIWDVPW